MPSSHSMGPGIISIVLGKLRKLHSPMGTNQHCHTSPSSSILRNIIKDWQEQSLSSLGPSRNSENPLFSKDLSLFWGVRQLRTFGLCVIGSKFRIRSSLSHRDNLPYFVEEDSEPREDQPSHTLDSKYVQGGMKNIKPHFSTSPSIWGEPALEQCVLRVDTSFSLEDKPECERRGRLGKGRLSSSDKRKEFEIMDFKRLCSGYCNSYAFF